MDFTHEYTSLYQNMAEPPIENGHNQTCRMKSGMSADLRGINEQSRSARSQMCCVVGAWSSLIHQLMLTEHQAMGNSTAT
jgi:hypothetical protein